MKCVFLSLALVWAIVGQSQATIETCQAMGLYFCSECENTDLQCHACTVGYTVKSDKTGCLKCTDTNCLQCSVKVDDDTQTDCQVCAAGYYLNDADKTCAACGINNCDICHMGNDSTIVCDQCDTGYYKVSDTECAACDISCSNCTATSCLVCKTPTYVVSGADPTKCAPCPGNCNTCVTGDTTTTTKCTLCNDGYYVVNDACSVCPGTGCKTCPDATCSACLDRYFLGDTSCTECSYQCFKCSDTTSCDTCNAGYTTKSSVDKSCDACPANCDMCTLDQAAAGTCTTCSTGYALDSITSKCVACSQVANCDTCTASSGVVTCTACTAGFIRDGNACYQCPSNCATGSCVYNTTAFTGFTTYCETCDSGYTTDDNMQCVSCGSCATCKWNSTYSTVECICSTESDTPTVESGDFPFRGHCESTTDYACNSGYFYTEQDPVTHVPSCPACIAGCSYCNTTLDCFTCDTFSGYAEKPKTDGTCYQCSTGSSSCAICSSTDGVTYTCDSCIAGYFPNAAGCSACPANCYTCSDATTCTTCYARTVKGSDGICYACPASCTACTVDADGVTTCTTCDSGFALNNGACEACPANCLSCEYFDGVLGCTDGQCEAGYQKLVSDNLCHVCPNNCATCTESATTPDLLVCDSCLSQFTLNDYSCAACPANCASCSAQGANIVCDTCNDGYYMDADKVCQKCFTDCVSCTSATTCDQCVTGKGMPADRSTCTDCATLTGVLNCATCIDATADTAAKCESCTTGYTISDDAKECYSIVSFGVECTDASDKPPSCTLCQDGVGAELVSNKCLINCYVCGTLVSNMPTTTVAQCNAQGSEYVDTQQCEFGCSIAVKYENSEMVYAARGCVVNATCLSDGVEQCTDVGPSQNCFKCCDSGELCNGDYWDPSSAPTGHVISVVMLLVAILTAYVIN